MGTCCSRKRHNIHNAMGWSEMPNTIVEENEPVREQPELQKPINDLMSNDPCEYNNESNRPTENIVPCSGNIHNAICWSEMPNTIVEENEPVREQPELQKPINDLMSNDPCEYNNESNRPTENIVPCSGNIHNAIWWSEMPNTIVEENEPVREQSELQRPINDLMSNDPCEYNNESNRPTENIVPCSGNIHNAICWSEMPNTIVEENEPVREQSELQRPINDLISNDPCEYNDESNRPTENIVPCSGNIYNAICWSEMPNTLVEENEPVRKQSELQRPINDLMSNDPCEYNDESNRPTENIPCSGNIHNAIWWSEMPNTIVEENEPVRKQSELQRPINDLMSNDPCEYNDESNRPTENIPCSGNIHNAIWWSEMPNTIVEENEPVREQSELQRPINDLMSNDPCEYNDESNRPTENIVPCSGNIHNVICWSEMPNTIVEENEPVREQSELQRPINDLMSNDPCEYNDESNRPTENIPCSGNIHNAIWWSEMPNTIVEENEPVREQFELQRPINDLISNDSCEYNDESNRPTENIVPCSGNIHNAIWWSEMPNTIVEENEPVREQSELQRPINDLMSNDPCEYNDESNRSTENIVPCSGNIHNAICWSEMPNTIVEENEPACELSELQRRVNDLMSNDPCEYNDESNRPTENIVPCYGNIHNAICWSEMPNTIVEENEPVCELSELQRRVNDLMSNDYCEYNDESNRPTENIVPCSTFSRNENPKRRRKKRKKKKKKSRPVPRVSFNTKFIPVHSKLVTNERNNKEICDNESLTSHTKNNKFTNVTAVPPSKMLTEDDFMATWFLWKNEFLIYMKSIDQTESNRQKWGLMLLNRMGPIGQKIHKTFTFDKDRIEEDIDILLKKFDFYYIFEGIRRGDNEEIDKYINDLTAMASRYTTDTDKIVKKKILMEVDKDKFTRKAQSLFPGFSYPSSIQSLSIKDMTNIWMLYERQTSSEVRKSIFI